MKSLKGFRTLIFNAVAGGGITIMAILDFFVQTANDPQFVGLLPVDWLPWYAFAVSLGNAILRLMTDTKVGKKG